MVSAYNSSHQGQNCTSELPLMAHYILILFLFYVSKYFYITCMYFSDDDFYGHALTSRIQQFGQFHIHIYSFVFSFWQHWFNVFRLTGQLCTVWHDEPGLSRVIQGLSLSPISNLSSAFEVWELLMACHFNMKNISQCYWGDLELLNVLLLVTKTFSLKCWKIWR